MPPVDTRKVLKSLERDFPKGQFIFSEGEETRELYILLKGEVEIRKNKQTIAVVRTPDTYLGEMSTLLGTPRTASLVAKTDCKMICVPESKVTDFFAHSPALGIKLAKVLAQRLQEMNIKYECMLTEVTKDEEDATPAFEAITSSMSHRKFLDYYKRHIGQSASMKDVVVACEIPMTEINGVLMNFNEAGLVKIEDRTISFMDAQSRTLRQMILNWAPA